MSESCPHCGFIRPFTLNDGKSDELNECLDRVCLNCGEIVPATKKLRIIEENQIKYEALKEELKNQIRRKYGN
jgi:transcription initiation factor IIE alpha subunit